MKEYFTTSYEQKRKDQLLTINESYNKLISTYKETSNVSDRENVTKNINLNNKKNMDTLDEYLSLLEKQIDIIDEKKIRLDNVEKQLMDLKNTNHTDKVDNLNELYKINNSWININIILIIVCIILAIIFFFFAHVAIDPT